MKAAIYCRLSEEDRIKQNKNDDSKSIQNQKQMLSQYSKSQGWEIYDIYSDDDYTGSDRTRPEFNRLLADAEARKFQIILCKTQSRFTRELELVEKYINGLFPIWNIRFISIVDNIDTAIKGNKKARQINGLINEWYLEDMSENIKSVLTNRRMNGLHIGSFALYGYKKDPAQKGHLIIDNEAAAVVREVFTLFSQGYGKTAIAKILNDRGVPNPTEYKRLHGLRYSQPKQKNSTLWKYFSISNMLVNEMYIGNMVQGKYGSVSYKTKKNKPRPKEDWYIVKNTHEPIINSELWDKVQAMIIEKNKPFSNGKIGLFARKVICAHCGYTMRSGTTKGYHYLTCSNRHISKNSCIGSYINQSKLECCILKEINKLANEFLNIDKVSENIEFNNNLNEKKGDILKNIEILQSKIDDYSKAIRDLYLDKSKGIISESDYIDFRENFSNELRCLKSQIDDAQQHIDAINEKINNSNKLTKENHMNIEHLMRESIEILIDHIEVKHRIPETNTIPINIFWNF